MFLPQSFYAQGASACVLQMAGHIAIVQQGLPTAEADVPRQHWGGAGPVDVRLNRF